MDIQKQQAFEAHFKTTEIYRRECAIRGKDILEFSRTMNGYFNIIANEAWQLWQAAKAQAAPKWISVEINSPNPHDQVLAFTNQNGTNIFETLFLDEFKDWKTTHWMPLPTSPLEQSHDTH